MRFDDERRPSSALAAARRAQVESDLETFIVKYEGLAARDKRNAAKLSLMQKQLREVESNVLRLKKDKSSLQKANRELCDENLRLKKTLQALRESWRVKVGSAATAPFRWVGSTRKSLQSAIVSDSKPASIASNPAAAQSSTVVRSTPRSVAEQGKLPRLISLDEVTVSLEEEFTSEPTKQSLIKFASHLYYKTGSIVRPAELFEGHSDLLTDLTPKEQHLVGLIQGFRSLLEQSIFLPPRQSNPVYQPERGRLLYCVHSTAPYNSNGYSTRTTGLIRGMQSAGTDLVVAARPGYPWDVKTDVPPESTVSYEKEIEGTVHFFSHGPNWTRNRLDHYLEQAADSYVQVATRTRADSIQAASNHVTALPALLAARRIGVPFTYEVRGLWEVTKASTNDTWARSEAYGLAVALETLVAKEADLVFAITSQVRDELIRRGVSADKIELLPNAVDTQDFSPMPGYKPTRAKLGIAASATVIGYAGSLVEYEGLDTLLEAASILSQEETDFCLVIVGDGSALGALKSHATTLGLADRVIFTGRVPAGEVSAYMSIFDITPCPRLPLAVTEMVSPLKPLEAMAAGKAVVLSDLAPLRDLAGSDGGRARLFRAGDSEDLSNVLRDLLKDPHLRLQLGRRARLWTVAERTWDKAGLKVQQAHKHLRLPEVAPSRALDSLTIGIIADTFTTEGLLPEAKFVKLHPEHWRDQLAGTSIDALIVESAWEGNGGDWTGKVGYYDDDSFAALRGLLQHCQGNSVPTIFWNKEDPIHFNRFRITAQHFEHVFTSDDASIGRYLQEAGDPLLSVASLPFYAQPLLHNPLPGQRPYEHTVTYAGSYYGDRYKERSDKLQMLLAAAVPSGLTIYDRQHLNPTSPYKFPESLSPYVRGGLEYKEMVEAYKAHPVHINVNSVTDSGTMFSRRVYEVAASGGVVLSGPGRGVERVFGGIIAVAPERTVASLLIKYWMNNEKNRNSDAWRGMRSVLRSHTAGQRLAYMLRTAGLAVDAPQLEKYAVVVDELTAELISQLENQSVRPTLILTRQQQPSLPQSAIDVQHWSEDYLQMLRERGITLVGTPPAAGIDRTYFEDLLTSRKYCLWQEAEIEQEAQLNPGGGLTQLTEASKGRCDLRTLESEDGGMKLVLRREVARAEVHLPSESGQVRSSAKRVLVAGHDLKFAYGIIEGLEAAGHEVLIDQWDGHSGHDERHSRELLAKADVIFCEWTLGNAEWYSHRKQPHQRLVTRLHLQEINTKYLENLHGSNIDAMIFVGQNIADIAIRDFGIETNKAHVIPNYVEIEALALQKPPGARWNLGLVGTVPQRKRLDLALDVLRLLRKEDKRYKLFVKGKRAEEFEWMVRDRPTELEYYREQYLRVEIDPLLKGAVHFEGQGNNMSEWYQNIGHVISVSDFESFHLTLADGAASRALPSSLAWAGADQIYPAEWLSASVIEMAERIANTTKNEAIYARETEAAQQFAINSFDSRVILPRILATILGR
jgi:glycosyltransferase involved in cell wall biosynthesis/spore maturation protein CgeB